MNHENDERLVAWMAEGPAHGPAANLQRAFGVTRGTRQRPAWLVAARGGTIAAERSGGQLRFGLIAVAVLVMTLIAGALIAGGLLPRPDPAPSPVVIASPDASTEPSADASPAAVQGRIVFTRRTRVADGEDGCTAPTIGWCLHSSIVMVNQDGSDERELIPGPRSEVLAMTPNGSSMLFHVMQANGDVEMLIGDGLGSGPRVLNTCGEGPCGDWGHTFSPDGMKLAFVRPGDNGETVIAVMDLRSDAVEELERTRVSNPDLGDPCHINCGAGSNEAPSWSSNSRYLVFARTGIGLPNQPPAQGVFLDSALFIADTEANNFRQLAVPTELRARDPKWSPDGSLIVFTSAIEQLALNELTGVVDNWQQLNDLYAIRPDGTELRRLTTDAEQPVGTTSPVELGARFASWTRDGRIVFSRGNAAETEPGWQVWVMDRDGRNQTQLDPSDAAALTAIGCITCPYPEISPVIGYPTPAFWIPAN